MGDVLDMNAYRDRLRSRRRLKQDMEDVSQHPAMQHPPGSTGWRILDEQPGFRQGEMLTFMSSSNSGKTVLGPTTVEEYLDGIIEAANAGSEWAQFKLAALQLTDLAPGAARESMQMAFPDMDPIQFEVWLDRATEEFELYSNILDEEI